MICARCLTRVARPQTTVLRPKHHKSSLKVDLQRRTYAPSSPNSANATSPQHTTSSTARQGSGSHTPPAATSTSAAQPFSTPLTPSPEEAGIQSTPSNKDTGRSTRLIQSSVPAGTPLRGLNFIKGKNDPLAKEDDEYPPWLWEILRDTGSRGDPGDTGDAAGDQFAKSKKQRRIAEKDQRKKALLNPGTLAPKVPLYEQSIDLPAGDGTLEGVLAAGRARDELTKAMRAKRRSTIKEDNFLRSMR